MLQRFSAAALSMILAIGEVSCGSGAASGVPDATPPIRLTPAAANEVKTIMKQQSIKENARLRIGAKGSLPNLSYVLDITEDPRQEGDVEFASQGITIVTDAKSLIYLRGTEVDFRDEAMGRGFVFRNPNATGSEPTAKP